MQILAGHLDDAHYHEKGFTLLEMLIAVAILGLLAAVVTLNLSANLRNAQIAAANNEVANVETAAVAYYATYRDWPSDVHTDLFVGGYVSSSPLYNYGFDEFGRVNVEDGTTWPNDVNIAWSAANHIWQK